MFENGRLMTQNGSIFFKGLRWLGIAGNCMKIDKIGWTWMKYQSHLQSSVATGATCQDAARLLF